MTNEIVIDIQRTGFPVKVGTVELWFDSSLENLRNFFKIEEIIQQKLKAAQEKAQHIHFPAEVDIDTLEIETVDVAIGFNKELIAVQYDALFGDGTFEKIYKVYPDYVALENAYEVMTIAIAKRIEELEKDRVEQTEAKMTEYLNKKAQKK